MKLKKWEIALLITFVVFFAAALLIKSDADALSYKLIRLHVLANSDSEQDQSIKLEVRNAVLAEANLILDGADDRGQAQGLLLDGLNRLENRANEVLAAHGTGYRAAVTLGEEFYPTRRYESFSLPAGEYTSLMVRLGSGEGKNWWCVVFPPVCTDACAVDLSDDIPLTDNEISLITEEQGIYRIKFKTVEIIESILHMFGA